MNENITGEEGEIYPIAILSGAKNLSVFMYKR
jgi:hypothetical protein